MCAHAKSPDNLDAILVSLSSRFSGHPEYQAIHAKLEALLSSGEAFLPAARALGKSLSEVGLCDEAKQIYQGLTERFPNDPSGPVCLAQLAMQTRSWQQALGYWDHVIGKFGDRLTPFWLGGRASTLLELNQLDEAGQIFENLTRDFPDDSRGFVGLAQLAMQRGLWSDALVLWDEILLRFAAQSGPHWHAGRARTLNQLDRPEEAEAIFQRLADENPAHAFGLAGQAEIAVRKEDWHRALALWEELIARFGARAPSDWQRARARALLSVGRSSEAEAIFRRMVESDADSLPSLLGLLHVLIAEGRAEEAAELLEASHFRELERVSIVEMRLRSLTMLRRFSEARGEFDRLLGSTRDVGVLGTLFAFNPSLHTNEKRTAVWRVLLSRLDELQKTKHPGSSSSVALRARIFLALREYDRFLALVSCASHRDLGEHWRSLLAVAAKLRDPLFPDYQAPKIFGVGLAKTGTSSLSAALAQLGFQTLHSYNHLTREVISEQDLFLFDAFTDAVVCGGFEKHYAAFPNSKFINTVRPFESWQKSMSGHFARIFGTPDFLALKEILTPVADDLANSFPTLIFRNNSYREVFDNYGNHVRRFFEDKPKERFVELDVFSGKWDELCAFVGRPIPASPFPWLNRRPSASPQNTPAIECP